MDTKYDGEGASRQNVLLVVVKKAMSCRQGKSVANLEEKKIHLELINSLNYINMNLLQNNPV